MKKKIILVVLIAIVLGVSGWQIAKREQSYFTHLNRITSKFISEMEKNNGFSCNGVGGSLAENIKLVSLTFHCHEKKSIQEARKLELNCIERFCEIINSNKKIQPYLEETPFPPERVEIMIHFRKKNLQNFPPGESISFVLSCNEKLVYKVIFNDQRPNQTLLRETFAEAYERLKGEQA